MSTTSTYNFLHVLLLDSNFKREWVLDVSDSAFKSNIDINTSFNRNNQNLHVILTLNFTAGIADKSQITSYIQMVGVFEIQNEGDLTVEQFATINGPAIMFPFLREHLAGLSVKAGINPILLAPVNFVQHNQNKALADDSN